MCVEKMKETWRAMTKSVSCKFLLNSWNSLKLVKRSGIYRHHFVSLPGKEQVLSLYQASCSRDV